MANGEGNQFSTYKIDYSEVEKHHTITFDKESAAYASEVRDFLIRDIKRGIELRQHGKVIDVGKGNFKGIVYKTYHFPEWGNMAIDLLNNSLIDDLECETWLNNINVSYVLLYVYKNNIYAMTGGFGSHLIRNYIEKNWALHLIPKFVQKDSGVIRQLKENNMFGNTSAMSKANRKTTNISYEQDMSTIFRELAIELGRELGGKLGIKYDDEESVNKKTGVLLKDSIVIRKNLTLDELEKVIEKIETIEQAEDQFPLGYFVSVKKKGIKTSDLLDGLINLLLEGKLDDFQLVGDDYLSYYMIASEYTLMNDKGEVYYSSADPICLEDIFEVFKEDKRSLSKSFMLSFLKNWKISAQDANGSQILYPITIINAIQGIVEYGENNVPCYIFQGQWYCMDEQYTPILREEFNSVYDDNYDENEKIKNRFGLKKCFPTENEYNNDFFVNKDVIVGHKALISNFEIADLIFWDSNYVYLMCNKKHFDGSGSRDLTNQIWASASYFYSQIQSLQKDLFLEKWYSEIENLYKKENAIMPVECQEFKEIFVGRNICYIAGYLTGFNKNSQSLYAKYLTIDLLKKMFDRGSKCISMSIE